MHALFLAQPPHSSSQVRYTSGVCLTGGEGLVSQPLNLAIVAHCVHVNPQKVADPSRDPERRGFGKTGRDHDRKPRVGIADLLSRHSPQQLAV